MKFWEYALESTITKAALPGLQWALGNRESGLADRFDDIAKNLRRYIGIVGDSYTPDNREETASLVESEGVASILRVQPNKYEPNELVEPYKELEDGSVHYLALDIDHPTLAIESSTTGHYHLYIKKPIRWDDYVNIMDAMAKAGLVEEGYVAAAKRRGWTCLRTPWTKKGFDRWGSPDKETPAIKDGRLPKAPWRTNPRINDPQATTDVLQWKTAQPAPVEYRADDGSPTGTPPAKLSEEALKVIEDAKREFKASQENWFGE